MKRNLVPVVTNPGEIVLGLLIIALGWGLVFYDPAIVVDVLIAAVAPIFWLLGGRKIGLALYLYPFIDKIKTLKTLLFWLSLAMAIGLAMFSLKFVALFVFVLTMLHMLNVASYDDRYQAKEKEITHGDLPEQPKSIAPKITTLDINSHTRSLALLLSPTARNTLSELIEAINKLAKQIPYLSENHAYLATSVHELIHDLSENTLIRLDEIAQKCITNGQVDASAQKLFLEKHEPTIVAKLQDNLKEVAHLTESIIEKQMAEFDGVGSDIETAFRESVMELKILLRWHVVHEQDDAFMTGHQVLLEKLETTTLKQMDEIFYKHDTSDEQKELLHTQVKDMITHFQNTLHTSETYAENAKNNPLLLEHSLNHTIPTPTDDFLAFNEQYIKQLKQHW